MQSLVDYENYQWELSRKIISECFWNAEVEAQLREDNQHNVPSACTREEIMTAIDQKRSSFCYEHGDCSDHCRAHGIKRNVCICLYINNFVFQDVAHCGL
jgi:hypothetical protein